MDDNTGLAEYYSNIIGKKIELNEDGDIITDLTEEEQDCICMDISIGRNLAYDNRGEENDVSK